MRVDGEQLRILHVMRAPVGGLFRHVTDLARGQTARGHQVGVIADSTTGGAHGEATLAELATELALGVRRLPMSRHLGWNDVTAAAGVARYAREVEASVVHGHGAKGGAHARLPRARRWLRVYTPHGGSLHYRWGSPAGFVFLSLERVLMHRTDLLLFESDFSREAFTTKVSAPRGAVAVVHNGVHPAEFEPVKAEAGATDLVFVGELRMLKGIDLLFDALVALRAEGHRLTATIVGDGPDAGVLRTRAASAGLSGEVRFAGVLPAREAFALGELLVVPSRAESLPYIVLEAAAAGMPMVVTRVGGLPEIYGPDAHALVAPDDVDSLGAALRQQTDGRDLRPLAGRLQARVRTSFTVEAMTAGVLDAYRASAADVVRSRCSPRR
ncbi:MAG: glycosyltransferase family 4 protein [Actinomycetes bacterium]